MTTEELREIVAERDAAKAEVAQIVEWLRFCRDHHGENLQKRGEILARKHHFNACDLIAKAIERGEHRGNYRAG
jgi:hypothetical protein